MNNKQYIKIEFKEILKNFKFLRRVDTYEVCYNNNNTSLKEGVLHFSFYNNVYYKYKKIFSIRSGIECFTRKYVVFNIYEKVFLEFFGLENCEIVSIYKNKKNDLILEVIYNLPKVNKQKEVSY